MKKRRELDALVGGGKSRRKNSNSGHELLRCNGSESSDDDFRVTQHKIRGAGICCSTCTSILVFLLLVACLLVCGGLTWMHVEMKKDLETLRTELHAVESRDKTSAEDVQKLYQQMGDVNKTFEAHTRTLAQIQSNISAFNSTLMKMSKGMGRLSEGIKAAPELKELPEKLLTVSKTLANLGSDVSGFKDTVAKVEPFIESTNSKLQSLKDSVNTLKTDNSGETKEPSPSLPPELSNTIQSIYKLFNDMNSTISTQVSVLMKSNTQHEERLASLEELTNTLSRNISSLSSDQPTTILDENSGVAAEHFKTTVTEIVKHVLSDMGGESEGVPSEKLDVVMKNLTQLANSLNSLQDTVNTLNPASSLPQEGGGGDQVFVTLQAFNTMEDGFHTQVQGLNQSMVNLKSDVLKLSGKIVQQSNSVSNLSHHVNALQQYIALLEHATSKPVVAGTTVKPVEVPSSEAPKTPTSTTESPSVEKSSTEKSSTIHTDTDTESTAASESQSSSHPPR